MSAPEREAVFLDTTIQVDRILGSRAHQQKIEARLRRYRHTVTSLVVQQEFRRRVLGDAIYLLKCFKSRRLISEVILQVQRLGASRAQARDRRRQAVCQGLLAYLNRLCDGDSEEERSERAARALRSLVKTAVKDLFEKRTGTVLSHSKCKCALQPIRTRGESLDLGHDNCDGWGGCETTELLESRRAEVQRIVEQLMALDGSQLTPELRQSLDFANRFLADPQSVRNELFCKRYGDLIIALESAGVPEFYTKNYRESQHLARALDQRLIVLPHHPDDPEREWPTAEGAWS